MITRYNAAYFYFYVYAYARFHAPLCILSFVVTIMLFVYYLDKHTDYVRSVFALSNFTYI